MWFIIGTIIGAVLMRTVSEAEILKIEAGRIKAVANLEDSRAISEYHQHNARLARARIKAQTQELETLHQALYAKRGETGKVILGVFNGGKDA